MRPSPASNSATRTGVTVNTWGSSRGPERQRACRFLSTLVRGCPHYDVVPGENSSGGRSRLRAHRYGELDGRIHDRRPRAPGFPHPGLATATGCPGVGAASYTRETGLGLNLIEGGDDAVLLLHCEL